MPRGYFRRRYRRRGYGGRRRVARRLIKRIARKVGRYSRIASTLRTGGWGRLNPGKAEKKYLDVLVAAGSVTSANATGILLNPCAQGTGVNQRVGNKITIKSIQWMVMGAYASDTVAYGQGVHVDAKIVCDTQANGTATDKISVNNGSSAPTMLNLDNRRRFIVIKHKSWQLAGANGLAVTYTKSAPSTFMWKGYKRMNMDVIFKSTGGSISDITTNSLYFIIQSNVAESTVSYDGYFRVRYTDA